MIPGLLIKKPKNKANVAKIMKLFSSKTATHLSVTHTSYIKFHLLNAYRNKNESSPKMDSSY
jgi:hypothetical protein